MYMVQVYIVHGTSVQCTWYKCTMYMVQVYTVHGTSVLYGTNVQYGTSGQYGTNVQYGTSGQYGYKSVHVTDYWVYLAILWQPVRTGLEGRGSHCLHNWVE